MERRSQRLLPALFPVALDLQYKVLSGRNPSTGRGQTSLFGSRTLVFTSDQEVRYGVRIELSVFWPVLLDDRVKLQLMIQGRAIGVHGNRITVSIGKHHFRTRGGALPSREPLHQVPRMAPLPAVHAAPHLLEAHA